MIWDYFVYIAVLSVLMWIAGAVAAWKGRRTAAVVLTVAGIVGMAAYVGCLWAALGRPPMRTMGETRLWYSLLLPLAGVVIYARWHYKWILSFTTVLATVFVCINLLKPEMHSKSLMPALQSPWFAPHVIVYMLAYAMLGVAFVMAVYLLFFKKKHNSQPSILKSQPSNLNPQPDGMEAIDNLVRVSYAFLTLGMLMGALWAKDAWGHYWSWDPKETWAAVTWLAYLVYIHYRHASPGRPKAALWMVIAVFCLLQMCWWGVNYLPSAQGTSIHTYSMQN